jgi:lipopolysaccharide/colanic/teichoic acid biosynthesis glycosyltransferase
MCATQSSGGRGEGSHALARRDAAKRLLDVIVAAALLVVVLPLLLLVAAAIRLDSRGPVLYHCRRLGRGGREFGMLKFRKMHRDATGAPLTAAADARLTRVGRFLTRMRLDELPQLWNVVTGEMSLVGPRPEDPVLVAQAGDAFTDVLSLKPGITGLAQLAFADERRILDPFDVVGDYLRRLLPRKLELDRLYASRWSLALDLRILWWTAVAVLFRRPVAVDRLDARLTVRRRSLPDASTVFEGANRT